MIEYCLGRTLTVQERKRFWEVAAEQDKLGLGVYGIAYEAETVDILRKEFGWELKDPT